MARGWESKGVEQQQEERAAASQPAKPRRPASKIRDLQRRQTLLLARQQTLHQLQASSSPQRRKMLEMALASLDAQVQSLDDDDTQGAPGAQV